MKEYLLSTNKFGEPKVMEGNEARGINILRLLLFKPGHNPLFPRMGCDLVKYRHIMSDELPMLQQLVYNQMTTYLPECMVDSVELEITPKNYINIIIQCQDDVAYTYISEQEIYPISLSNVY